MHVYSRINCGFSNSSDRKNWLHNMIARYDCTCFVAFVAPLAVGSMLWGCCYSGGATADKENKRNMCLRHGINPNSFFDMILSCQKGSRTPSTQVPNTSFEPLKDWLAGVHLASESIVGTSGTPSTGINLAFEIPHFQHNSVYTFGIASRNPHAPHRTPRTPSAPVPNCKLEP